MTASNETLGKVLLRNNILARVVAFGVLAPLTVFLAKPLTFPTEAWPALLSLFWGFSALSLIPIFLSAAAMQYAAQIEEVMVYIETVVAGIWASTFGFDLICIWGIIAAGVFNNVAVRGYIGFMLGVLGAALGLAIGAFWLDHEFVVTMSTDVAMVVLPLFLVFMLVAEGRRIKLVGEMAELKVASDSRAEHIRSLNQQIKEQVLARYLPPELINDIFQGKLEIETKPSTQQITVLFSDLSGFTRLSEKQGAEVVAEFLNDYLSTMNQTIFENHGTIDKFIGDAIMVLFGAPTGMEPKEQVENAARCAEAMQKGMAEVNARWKPRGLGEVFMRIGIHHGTAVVGNFGSAKRVDYTAIGPNVNLASRIETVCEPGSIFVSPEVSKLLSSSRTEKLGEYDLKGITGKTSLYRLARDSD